MELEIVADSPWCRIVRAKYCDKQRGGALHCLSNASPWWRDLWAVCYGDVEDCWFERNVDFSIGNGRSSLFWKDKWIGIAPLKSQFLKLFFLSPQKNSSIHDLGRWVNGHWILSFRWRRELSIRESGQLASLQQVLMNVNLRQDCRDLWRGKHESDGKFTVCFAYAALNDPIEEGDSLLFKRVWSVVVLQMQMLSCGE